MEQSNKSKTIIKVIICFGAFAVFGVVALIVTAVLIFQSVTSPAHIKTVAANFMTLADPLPKGFTYTAAYEVGGFPIVQITDVEQQNLYTFSSTGDPSKEQAENFADLTDKDKLVALKLGLAAANKGQLTSNVTGQLMCANEIMCYSIGHTDTLGPDSTVNNGFGALSQSSKTGRSIYLCVEKQSWLQRNGPAIDLTRIKELLSAIKSF